MIQKLEGREREEERDSEIMESSLSRLIGENEGREDG